MSSNLPTGPTPYEEVNTLLRVLLTRMQANLGQRFVGLYLYGSLSLGDFDPTSSDIDFLAVITENLPQDVFERLREMHTAIAASGLPYANWLEGSYIPREALRRYDPNNAYHATVGVDWEFQMGMHGSNWIIERYIVREHGIVVWGPSPEAFIDPVSCQQLQTAVCEQLKNFWQLQLNTPEWLRPRNYQAFAMLTLCRALYTLHTGRVSSKPQAAIWTQQAYPQWKSQIERALAWRSQHELDDLTETQAFLRDALTVAQDLCKLNCLQ